MLVCKVLSSDSSLGVPGLVTFVDLLFTHKSQSAQRFRRDPAFYTAWVQMARRHAKRLGASTYAVQLLSVIQHVLDGGLQRQGGGRAPDSMINALEPVLLQLHDAASDTSNRVPDNDFHHTILQHIEDIRTRLGLLRADGKERTASAAVPPARV